MHDLGFEKLYPDLTSVFGDEVFDLRASLLEFSLEDELPLSIGVK